MTYDDAGNLTSDSVNTYTWDARNQLSAITGGVSASFGYDAFGRRSRKTVSSTTRYFLYDRVNVVQEADGSGPLADLLKQLMKILLSFFHSLNELEGLGAIFELQR